MAAELHLYVSAAPEMDAECELLGQTLASMARTLRWSIKRTPGPHEYGNPDLPALRDSQFYVILLGSDIVAPIGVEWRAARDFGLTTFAFRHAERIASPAAAFFARASEANWVAYHSPQEFVRRFERDLIATLVAGTPGYGLDLTVIEELVIRQEALEKEEDAPEKREERRGAGGGGVILSVGPQE